eukprot:CAMPEP_0181376792 /NCGR_PEP_ID=MMETSP1106-20121128/17519_1 /TAXON_ID=81844 /ORGANISM="Mantoniella antarctica, Strain SL-175" /LENGTH=163 /DNA_ID=CAMNT_0023495417 /DNA_START=19 /DNA_END=511 /DNA_ORIENTATION=-
MSGVLPTDQCREEFFKMKNKRAYKFITFKINKEEGKTTTTEVLEVHKKEVSGAKGKSLPFFWGEGLMMRGDAGRQLSPGFRHDLRHWEHREVGTPTAGTQHNGWHNRWHFDYSTFLWARSRLGAWRACCSPERGRASCFALCSPAACKRIPYIVSPGLRSVRV